MKKLWIALLLVSICGFLFAQDTVFSVYSEKKEPITIMFPKGVYNSDATMDQNIDAWHYHQRPLVSEKSEWKYKGFKRTVLKKTNYLFFNGEKNTIVTEVGKIMTYFALELVIIFIISFTTMSFLQRFICNKKLEYAKTLTYVLLILATGCMALLANLFMRPIDIALWTLVVSLGITTTYDRDGKIKFKRNIFLIFNIFLSVIFILPFLSNYFLVYVYYLAGLITGIPTFYYWRYRRKKKLMEKPIVIM